MQLLNRLPSALDDSIFAQNLSMRNAVQSRISCPRVDNKVAWYDYTVVKNDRVKLIPR